MDTKKQARMQRNRSPSYYRTYEDSPNFYKNAGAISAGETALTDIETEFPNAVKFFPITNVQVVNSSSVDIIFYPNQRSAGFLIPSGSSTIFDRRTLAGGVRTFKISNTSASVNIADKEVEINFWREGVTFDKAFEQMHKAFFKFVRGGFN